MRRHGTVRSKTLSGLRTLEHEACFPRHLLQSGQGDVVRIDDDLTDDEPLGGLQHPLQLTQGGGHDRDLLERANRVRRVERVAGIRKRLRVAQSRDALGNAPSSPRGAPEAPAPRARGFRQRNLPTV